MLHFASALRSSVLLIPLLHSHDPTFPPFARADSPAQESIPRNKRDTLLPRPLSPTDVCFRWAHQSAIVNGTLYLYGGQATTDPDQTQHTWNNNFLALDLTRSWPIAAPALTGLPQPSGPPEVALGYLWNSRTSLFLYGGQFDWKPAQSPTPFSTWEYNIARSSWIEHGDPVTSSGDHAPSNGDPVQRSAEGAGANVPSLGRGFYFGGHQDHYTTDGWSQTVPRIYLQSLLEYTFPAHSNAQVESLRDGETAGSSGVYRNITKGGLQARAGFTQRADGLLIHVPGFGKEGILLALAGGTNDTFTQMNNVNVYDLATSSWYTQATSGESPKIRVNPCAVMAAAQDGSSYNIYMFGGQNLIPFGDQTQYNDMWILTLPSFTWIKVDQTGQGVPYGRSGHTCNIWDAQMVVVGGYTGENTLTCESPGIYTFDLSSAKWVNQFTALSDVGSDHGGSPDDGQGNPFSQQPAQKFSGTNSGGLEGSYGYEVPDVVVKVIGGNKTGGATLTAPVYAATAGPLATGKPITYALTNPNGSTTLVTHTTDSSGSGVKVAAIVAGCVAGVLFIVACYLAFCAWVYRKQLRLYQRHVNTTQAQARGEKFSPHSESDGTDPPDNSKSRISGFFDPTNRRSFLVPGTRTTATTVTTTTYSDHGSSHLSVQSPGLPADVRPHGQILDDYQRVRRSSDASEMGDEDLLGGREPTFVGVIMNPRRSLRVINQD